MIPEMSFRRDHPQYVRIIARMYSGRDPEEVPFRDMLREASHGAYTLFTRAVAQALPALPQDVLIRRVNLAVATAASFLLTPWVIRGLEELSGESLDETVLIDHVVRLIESGLAGEASSG